MSGFAKFIIFSALLYAGGKYGGEYLLSNDFEVYADRTKAPWTCQLEIIFGKLHFMRDDYDKAMMRYSHAIARCPGSSEEAEFEMARCLEAKQLRTQAYEAYTAFVKKYPGSRRAKAADRSADILHGT